MLKTILGLLLLAGPAHATGYLQGADFATCAQITAAGGVCSQLLNTSAIWDDVDSVVLDTQIAIWNAKQGALTFPNSVINTAGAVTLSGDVTSPGNSFYYGTNGAGTKGWYVLPAPGTGTVTSVSGVAANGFTVGVATATTTPAITIGTSVAAGMVKSSGTGLLAAVAGTDYSSGTSALATGIVKSTTGTGALTIAASGTDYAPATSGTSILYGNGAGGFSNVTIGTNLTFVAGTLNATGGGGGGGAAAVLTKTAAYSLLTTDFGSGYVALIEMNCASACTLTLFAASNSGYQANVINIGSATVTVSTAGSDTFGSTTDTTWTLIPGGSPQSSNKFISNGGSRWAGF
jgi:hypothetical protein